MEPGASLADPALPKKRILVACRDGHIGRLVQVNLERAGYQVTIACSSQQALEEVHAEAPDLVLLDPAMAHLERFDLLRALKADPGTRGIVMCMLTPEGGIVEPESPSLRGGRAP